MRTRFQWCPIQQKVVPTEEVMVIVPTSSSPTFINDEMPPTKHPIDGQLYTSKAKFRAITRAHGFDEVGNEYEKGYEPERQLEKDFDRYIGGMKDEFRRRFFDK